MDRKEARKKYHSQRQGAKRRGIEWRLTFQQWLDWWGEDLDNRGRRPWNLQMQRVADSGAYEIGNIRKGIPKENGRTRSAVHQNQKSLAAVLAYQNGLNQSDPAATDAEDPEDESISAYMSRDRDDILIRRCKYDAIRR